MPLNTVVDLKCASKLESNEQEKLTSARKPPGFQIPRFRRDLLKATQTFRRILNNQGFWTVPLLFFVTRSLCLTMNNLYPLSIFSAMFTFSIMVKSTVLLICFIDFSCFVIFSVRCLMSLTPLRVQVVSPLNSGQG